jgi:hypothetical protein
VDFRLAVITAPRYGESEALVGIPFGFILGPGQVYGPTHFNEELITPPPFPVEY